MQRPPLLYPVKIVRSEQSAVNSEQCQVLFLEDDYVSFISHSLLYHCAEITGILLKIQVYSGSPLRISLSYGGRNRICAEQL